ncbi:P-II family nitrogen regulator [Methanobrevibacter curvatus]|jgi:nitrogen regulatory protein PII 1|uniref:Nitrogen regulatory protein P-II n=1 Tax=Methanobrevibacter curvatus TaxID=49547 RepID=A0A166DYG9_9EURY|nr:P-II family nitrogen regulator [Methanobrevibacter curvatus]KZX16088.1 nitrogen regulatory protein P-II [Methanobrevibacter curvatus]MDR3062752.1 P-II family nitrogen regulator [Methanobrevibacter sp.]
MKMIRAIVRPEKIESTVNALEEKGHIALTKIDVIGRGKQKGIHQNNIHYDELPKRMIMLVAEDEQIDPLVDTIVNSAYTGNFGDGKIFISPVEEAYTVRTREKGL